MNDRKMARESKLTKEQEEWRDLLERVKTLINDANNLNSVDLQKQVAALKKVLKTNNPSRKTRTSVLNAVIKLEEAVKTTYAVNDKSSWVR